MNIYLTHSFRPDAKYSLANLRTPSKFCSIRFWYCFSWSRCFFICYLVRLKFEQLVCVFLLFWKNENRVKTVIINKIPTRTALSCSVTRLGAVLFVLPNKLPIVCCVCVYVCALFFIAIFVANSRFRVTSRIITWKVFYCVFFFGSKLTHQKWHTTNKSLSSWNHW